MKDLIKYGIAPGLILAFSVVSEEAFVGAQEVQPFSGRVLEQAALGEVPSGRYAMKGTLLVMQPNAEIPSHTHVGPGLRYVLEGAITIGWIDGRTQTFSAGSTYFEGPGDNHPPGAISARNPGETVTRVWIVELVPDE